MPVINQMKAGERGAGLSVSSALPAGGDRAEERPRPPEVSLRYFCQQAIEMKWPMSNLRIGSQEFASYILWYEMYEYLYVFINICDNPKIVVIKLLVK